MATDTTEKHVALFFKRGSSDKEYHLHLVPRGQGWVVDYQYGRRGSALRSGTKTAAPVGLEEATKCYNKVMAGQLRDGYTPAQGGAAYQDTPNADRFTGLVPQLLNPIDETDLDRYLDDPSVLAQQKYDGERRLLRVSADKVEGVNRNGLRVALPKAIATEAASIAAAAGDFVADAEDMGDCLYIFDLLEHAGTNLRQKPVVARLAAMERIFARSQVLRPVATARTAAAKRALIDQVRSVGGEGVVFKDASAPYTPGRPASAGPQVKFKFTASATVRVHKVNTSRRSVGVQMRAAAGVWVNVGNVTVPPNRDVPPCGSLVEVRYLYAFRGGSLYQPVLDRLRSDMDESDCALEQLRYKDEPAPPASKKTTVPSRRSRPA